MNLSTLKQKYALWKYSLSFLVINKFASHFPSRTIRGLILRFYGAKIAKNVSLFSGFEIRDPNNLRIDEGTSIGLRVLLDARKGLHIGRNVTISSEAIIWTLHHDYNDPNFKGVGASVTIGEYAWICSRAIILPGIIIGKGAVVACGAVVTKNVEPYSVVGGIPARKISMRDPNSLQYVPFFPLHMV